MKKIAVVACGWHYPSHFYEEMIKQKVPAGYTIEYYVVMHRDPVYSHSEHDIIITNPLNYLDKQFYKKNITESDINSLGWTCIQGVSGCEWQAANTWLSCNNYKDYEYILFCGDDTYVISDNLFIDVLTNNELTI